MAHPTKRLAGTVKLNGLSYRIATDENSQYLYDRKSAPKVRVETKRGVAGETNLVEFPFLGVEGYGDAKMSGDREHYHWATNFYMGHEGEAVVLPGYQIVKATSGNFFRETSRPPVGVFEIVGSAPDLLTTYILQDCEAYRVEGATNAQVSLELNKTFEAGTMPTDTTQFNNIGYVAMGADFPVVNIISVADDGATNPRFATATAHGLVVGDLIRISGSSHSTTDLYNGIWIVDEVSDSTHFDINALTYAAATPDLPVTARVHKIVNRYLRRFKDSAWSKDDNTYKAVTAVANSGGNTSISVTGHGYSAGDFVYFVNMDRAAYNSMSAAGVSTLYQIISITDANTFVCNLPFSVGTATGHVNRQDSDVFAEHLIISGDLIVRAYKDIDLGWVTSRADVVDGDPMRDANWTAGIGTIGAGDQSSPITDLVAIGDGEMIMKAEGAFTFKKKEALYTNEITELEEHRHPENGRGSCEYKGWVYIPTIIGTYRYRNGQVQDITPGRGGIQEFTSPVGPIGWMTGDMSRLLAVTRPFRVNQPKNVADDVTKVYVDYNNAGSPVAVGDWNLDPTTDLNTITAAGFIYLGCTQPWHRMFVEMDAVANTLADATLTGLWIDSAQYWNGTTWVTRSGLIDYTRVRKSSALFPSSFGQSGDLVFTSEMPTDWDTGGTTPLGVDLGTENDMYWCRFSLSAAIGVSVIIRRIVAGIHIAQASMTPTTNSKEMTIDHGGMQFVLEGRDEPDRGFVWRTLWGWQSPETTMVDDNSGSHNGYTTGGAQPVGACAIVQPNALRAGPTGNRYLFVGLHHNSVMCPLGHTPDPTEDGPYHQVYSGSLRHHWLVWPDTDCGLPGVTKTLMEIDFDLSSEITGANVDVYYRVNGGAWTRAGDADPLPLQLTAGSEPSGLTFGLALHVHFSADSRTVELPRLITLPVLRVQPRPEQSETILLTLELDGAEDLPRKKDRRSAKTAYAALKALQEQAASVAYVDADESTDNVHVNQVRKRIRLNSDGHPTVVADVMLSVVP